MKIRIGSAWDNAKWFEKLRGWLAYDVWHTRSFCLDQLTE